MSPYSRGLAALFPDLDVQRVRLVRGSWQGRLFGKLGNIAVTFGYGVHLTPRLPAASSEVYPELVEGEWLFRLYGHECFHVLQYQKAGSLRFLLLYGLDLAWTLLQGRAPTRHPLEVDAYAAGNTALEYWRRVLS